jgi:gamma-glutamyltranspeptidase/glutathione hydrolase
LIVSDKGYAEKVRAVIRAQQGGHFERLEAGRPAARGTNTTHYSIVDNQGNTVSVTYT